MYIRAKDSNTSSAGTPYYIGKGSGKRAYAKHKNNSTPKDKNLIIIVKTGLTENEAFNLERELITQYGRKNANTGILINLTNGGDGISGFKHSAETLEKLSNASKGKKKTEDHKKI